MNHFTRLTRGSLVAGIATFAVLLSSLLPSMGPVAFADAAAEDIVGMERVQFGAVLGQEGKRKGDKLYFAYARRVYESLLADKARSEQVKDLARYGLAELNSEAAIGAMGRPVPYKDVVTKIREACDALEAFANKYPDHPKANEAKLKVGTTRLGFVLWARNSLLGDEELMKKRDAQQVEVLRDAKTFVDIAINHFDKLRKGHDSRNPTELAELAQYSWVQAQHYRALVMDRCSNEAIDALDFAQEQLDEFTLLKDGTLVGVYALDILGMNWEEKAQCATEEDAQQQAYMQALQNYSSCMDTPNEGPSYLEVITRGYFHFARACNAAGRLKGTDFYKIGVDRVGPMLQAHPQAWRKANGVNALIQLGLLHANREHMDKAIEALTVAAEKAKASGNSQLERLANEHLKGLMRGGGSGGGGGAEPEVLKRVADAFYAEKKWSEAALGYKQVAESAPRTEAAFKTYLADAWRRMSRCYKEMGDLLGAALALEPMHEAWVDGVFTYDGTPADENLNQLGDLRYGAIGLWRKLGEQTGAAVFQARASNMLRAFKKDYPGHHRGETGTWTVARQLFAKALDEKKAKKSTWKKNLGDAVRAFQEVANDPDASERHRAWVYLIQAAYMRDSTDDMINVGKKAQALWNSDEVKAKAREFASQAAKIKEAKGELRFWLAQALVERKQWDDVITTLDGYHSDHENMRGTKKYASTLGHLVKAHLGKGDIDKADGFYRRLVKEDPGFSGLPSIAQHFASFYNQQAKALATRLRDLVREAKKLKPEVTVGERQEWALYGRRSSLSAKIGNAQRAVDTWKEAEAEGTLDELKGLDRAGYEQALKDIPKFKEERDELQKKINAFVAGLADKRARLAQVLKEIEEAKGGLYEPRSKAAGYFYRLHKALVEAGKKPIASNVKVFGDLYRQAAKLRPEVRENWNRARELYEYFVEMKSADADSVQEALGYLGGIYYRLASTTEDETERDALVQLAKDRLATSVAKVPENAELVMAQLVGDYGVLPWFDPTYERKHYFALPKGMKSVDEFKRLVGQIGRPGGPKYPRFAKEADNKQYLAAAQRFAAYLSGVREKVLQRAVNSFKRPSADVNFFALHGNTGRDFRLALAWVYSVSGEIEDYRKAVALANTLVRGSLAVEEGSEDWWLARVILLEALVGWSETASKGAAAGSTADAKTMIERASKSLAGLKSSFPSLGKDDRPQTPQELQELLKRIERQRLALDLRPLNLVLTPEDPAGSDNK